MINKPNIVIIANMQTSRAPLHYGMSAGDGSLPKLADSINFLPMCGDFIIDKSCFSPSANLADATSHQYRKADKAIGLVSSYAYPSIAICGLIIGKDIVKKTSNKSPAVNKNQSSTVEGVDTLSATLQEKYPWIPVIDENNLKDPLLGKHFIACVKALHELNQLRKRKLTRHGLIAFHTRYKLLLLAHSQPAYREIGPFMALIHQWQSLEAFFEVYREKLMAILQLPTSRENHTNVLMHIQGYFRPNLSSYQRGELSTAIDRYRRGTSPLDIPLNILRQYLSTYPIHYLSGQKYLTQQGDNI